MKWAMTTVTMTVAAALLSGCAARSLSVLQSEFNAAVDARNRCQSQVAYEPDPDSTCTVDYRTVFADIAAQAQASLRAYKGGPGVTIGLHRLHAYALWQSGASEKTVAQAARQGLAECAGDNYARAPRDCALLATIGGLKGVEAAGTAIDAIHAGFTTATDKTAACKEAAVEWRTAAADYWHTYYLPLATDMKIFADRAETPAGVLQYLQAQHRLAFDQLLRLKTIGRQCIADDRLARQLIACPCNPDLRTNADQDACNTVFDPDFPEYAFFFDTFCMSEDAFQSDDCPCDGPDSANWSDRQQTACDYVKLNPGAKALHEARCKVKKALTTN